MSQGNSMNYLGQVREMVGEQVEYRELLLQMILRDLLLRYKQTVLGFGWAVFMPIVNTIVFSIIFTRVTHIETRAPYPLFAYCGFLVWNFFAASLRFSVLSLTNNSNLVKKVYFPREIFPFSAILVCLVDFLVGSVVLGGLMIYYGYSVTPALLFLPIVVAVSIAFTAGIALILAMSNLFYRDVKYITDVILTTWMFGTAVAYPVEGVGGQLGILLAINPMTQIVNAYRDVVLYGQLPAVAPFAATASASVVVLMVGWHLFHRAEFAFAEHI
ncbi:MAG TPA: ABC transporter permease [Vicinamibacterales bacterium]|nr:ABC transporter permease [Vicinamibacterales bacterium]